MITRRWHKLRVLIAGEASDLQSLLVSHGVQITRQLSTGSAIPKLSIKTDYDLLLLELSPIIETSFGRSIAKLSRTIPIIATIDSVDDSCRKIAFEIGVRDVLLRPVEPATLFSSIERALEQNCNFVNTEGYCGPDRRRDVSPLTIQRSQWNWADLAFLGTIPLGVRRLNAPGLNTDRANRDRSLN